MKVVHIGAGKPYDAVVSAKLPGDLKEQLMSLAPGAERFAVVSDETVWGLYGSFLSGLDPVPLVLKPGEQSKNADNYIWLLERLAEERFRRSDLVILLGGGVPGDVGGFAAASYMRGIPFVQIPTTLLAMVDSSVGGKTAIDLAAGKNLAGAFCQPLKVFCSTDMLDTLPAETLQDGLAEVVKYAVLGDPELFAHLEANGTGFDREDVVSRCIAAKASYVETDEFDTGMRKLLNLGHTAAHGIEAESGYSISHGRAVGIGLAVISRAAVRMGRMEASVCEKIISLIRQLGLSSDSPYDADTLLPRLLSDKKWSAGKVDLIVPTDIGHAEAVPLDANGLAEWIRAGCSE